MIIIKTLMIRQKSILMRQGFDLDIATDGLLLMLTSTGCVGMGA